jgi:hypothetical protein
MTFFYDLNKKLDSIREKPETTHKQLNERDMGKHNNKTTGFDALAKKAGKEYGSKAAGERVAGAQFQKMKKSGKIEEEGMSRAAKGYEKYGKQGMQALAKAGREGKALDPIRNKYNKYDDKEVDESLGSMAKKAGSMVKKVGGAVLNKLGHGSDEDMRKDLQRKMGMPQTGKKPEQVKEKMSPAKAKSFAALAEPRDKITFADKIAGAKKEVDEMLGDVAAEAIKSALTPKQKKLDKNQNGRLDANDFAMLRKGGKKQVADEGFPTIDSAREEMRKRKVGDVTHGAKHDVEEIPGGRRVTRRTDAQGYSVGSETDDEGNVKSTEKRNKAGRPEKANKKPERVTANATKHKGGRKTNENDLDITDRGEYDQEGSMAKDDIKTIVRHAQALQKVLGDNDNLPEWVQAKLAKIEGMMTAVDDYMQNQTSDQDEQDVELDEKATSKKQQKFMGMVHATQKGEKAPSKEVAKVAKTMKKSDAEDFASTKHQGLPEKKKPQAKSDASKKKEKTEEAGGSGTPTASSGFSYGQGIYDSMNRELETMIRESMNVSMSMNTDANGGPSKSITVTATDDDAMKLGELLKNAGLAGDHDMGNGAAEVEVHGAEDIADKIRQAMGDHEHAEGETCDACGQEDCGCEQEMDEAYGDDVVSQNSPDFPSNTETSHDAFQYSGGLNKPKSSGMATIPVTDVVADGEDNFGKPARTNEDDLARLREMAGIRAAKKDVEEEKTDEGNLFTKGLADNDVKVGEKIPGTNAIKKKDIDESILDLKHLWSQYKG